MRPELRRKLIDAGVAVDENSDTLLTDTLNDNGKARRTLLFPRTSDLPLALPERWRSIRLIRTKIPGTLGVLSDERREFVDRKGRASCIELSDEGSRLIVFSPEFDCSRLEYVLLFHSMLKKEVEQ